MLATTSVGYQASSTALEVAERGYQTIDDDELRTLPVMAREGQRQKDRENGPP